MAALCEHNRVACQVNSLAKYSTLGFSILSVLKIHRESETLECQECVSVPRVHGQLLPACRGQGKEHQTVPVPRHSAESVKTIGLNKRREERSESRSLNPAQFSVYLV